MDLSVGSKNQQRKTPECAACRRKQKGVACCCPRGCCCLRCDQRRTSNWKQARNHAHCFALWGYAWAFQPARTTIGKRNPIAQSSLQHTHEVKVPSPLRFLTRPVEPEMSRPSGHSKSGSCGNPLGEGGLNPRGGTGLRSKPSATEQSGDPLGEEGLNPKGETNWHGGTSWRSDSALLSSAHKPGNESGSAGSTDGACSALLHVQSLTGDMHGPLGRLEPPAAKDT